MPPINLLIEKLLLKIPKVSAFTSLMFTLAWLGFCSYITILSRWNFVVTVLVACILSSDQPKRWATIAHTFPCNFKAIIVFIRFRMIWRDFRNHKSINGVFKKWAQVNPAKACILFEDQLWTYKQMDEFSNRVANLFRSQGYTKGDVVALLMDNRPEYIGMWLGLAKIGVITALVNCNLRQQSLAHSINVSHAKVVIFSAEFINAVDEVRDSLQSKVQLFVMGTGMTKFARCLSPLIENSSIADPPDLDIKLTDRLIYIYTSGTTGLPKPAVITHARFIHLATGCYLNCWLNTSDRFYVPLPLFHTAGCLIGVGQAIVNNVTVALRSKFSASQFWDDCIRYRCTASQYIGETCRYLLAQPERPQDSTHRVRVLFGNGLREQLWDTFKSRFHIQNIVEFYGSTEGNANMINLDNSKGAVGFKPVTRRMAYMLIRVDKQTGAPIRNDNGMCIQCPPGETGELVGRIDSRRADRHFEGYVNQSDSEKKIISDVFTKGDKAFASGDLLVMDRYGYFYFKDRTGDTFRWKGENVSTAEVENVVGKIIGLKECAVYGVEVPGNEGKAGMLAIVDPNFTLDFKHFAVEISKALPAYSRPIFVRLAKTLPMTSTFKLKKIELQKDGFDPTKCGCDRLYYLSAPGRYDVIDRHNTYLDICHGKMRF